VHAQGNSKKPLDVLREENELLRSTIEASERDTKALEQQLEAGARGRQSAPPPARACR